MRISCANFIYPAIANGIAYASTVGSTAIYKLYSAGAAAGKVGATLSKVGSYAAQTTSESATAVERIFRSIGEPIELNKINTSLRKEEIIKKLANVAGDVSHDSVVTEITAIAATQLLMIGTDAAVEWVAKKKKWGVVGTEAAKMVCAGVVTAAATAVIPTAGVSFATGNMAIYGARRIVRAAFNAMYQPERCKFGDTDLLVKTPFTLAANGKGKKSDGASGSGGDSKTDASDNV